MAGEWIDFQAVKAAVSLAEVLHLYQVDWLRGRRPGQLQGRCPIHRGGRLDAFHVSLRKNAFQCFACQAHGNVLDFVAAMEHCSVREAARRLAHRFSVAGPPAAAAVPAVAGVGGRGNWLGKNERTNPPLSFTLRGVDGSHPYVRARGILPETANHFGVGFYAGRGLMSGKVVIPIHDSRGELVAYAGRSVDGSVPKYRLPAGFRKSEVLFNFHRAARCEQDSAVVVEGYFDCLKVHQAGFACVVGLMGTVLSEATETLLIGRFRRVVLMLDGDDSGRRTTARIDAQLEGKVSIRRVTVPDGSQPDQLQPNEIRALLHEDWERTMP